MVKCGAVDGDPCKCELTNPCVNYMVATIVSNILKMILKEISPHERNELHEFVRLVDACEYVKLYAEDLDNHRGDTDGPESCIGYITDAVVSGILKAVLKTITPAERDELRKFAQMPGIDGYIKTYITTLDKHREVIGGIVLNTKC